MSGGHWICWISNSFNACTENEWLFKGMWLTTWFSQLSSHSKRKTVLLSILSTVSFQTIANYVSKLQCRHIQKFHTITRGHRALIIIFTFHLLNQSSWKRLISCYNWIPKGTRSLWLHTLQLNHSSSFTHSRGLWGIRTALPHKYAIYTCKATGSINTLGDKPYSGIPQQTFHLFIFTVLTDSLM